MALRMILRNDNKCDQAGESMIEKSIMSSSRSAQRRKMRDSTKLVETVKLILSRMSILLVSHGRARGLFCFIALFYPPMAVSLQ